ncbi:MAG: hypothetical protein LBP96_03550, partial [Bacteroidales bacterium]|nr:hypothetical protein [Bacteroidales bacterium]
LLHNSVNPLIDGVFTEGELVSSVGALRATYLHDDTYDGNVFKRPLENVEIPFSIAQKQPF